MASRLYEPGEMLRGTVYRVVKHLATGGMGTVYDVEDTTVGKRYVLKTLHPDLFGRNDLARRMEAEARTLGRLQHPNIVEVVTAGTTQDELRLPYYVMERLNGQNLRTILEKKGALDAAHAYRIAIDLLDALEHAHDNGVIHRDVKPENIFLHRNHHGQTTTKLLDFGIMRLLDGAERGETAGRFVGTLRYASPEQIRVDSLGASTDLYSAGLVLYEMLSGHGPFDEVRDAGAAHLNIPAPPLSRFARVSPLAERVVMASLSKRPEERPKDAFSYAAELRRVLRGEEEEQRPETKVNPLSMVAPSQPAPRFAPDATTRGGPQQPARAHAHQATAPMLRPPVSPVGDTIVNPHKDTLASAGVASAAANALAATELAAVMAVVPSPRVSAPVGALPVDRNAETRAFAYATGPRVGGSGTAYDAVAAAPRDVAPSSKPNNGAMDLRFPPQGLPPSTSTSGSEVSPASIASPRTSFLAALGGGCAALGVLGVIWVFFFREPATHSAASPHAGADVTASSSTSSLPASIAAPSVEVSAAPSMSAPSKDVAATSAGPAPSAKNAPTTHASTSRPRVPTPAPQPPAPQPPAPQPPPPAKPPVPATVPTEL